QFLCWGDVWKDNKRVPQEDQSRCANYFVTTESVHIVCPGHYIPKNSRIFDRSTSCGSAVRNPLALASPPMENRGMEEPRLRMVEWLSGTAGFAVCNACRKEFRVPMKAQVEPPTRRISPAAIRPEQVQVFYTGRGLADAAGRNEPR